MEKAAFEKRLQEAIGQQGKAGSAGKKIEDALCRPFDPKLGQSLNQLMGRTADFYPLPLPDSAILPPCF